MLKASHCRIIAILSQFLPSAPGQSVVKTAASPFKTVSHLVYLSF